MSVELVLLGVVAACSFATMLALAAVAVVLWRASRDARALQDRVEGTLRELEKQAIPALGDAGGLFRSLSGLASAGQRLTEEVVVTHVARRLAGKQPCEQRPAGSLALLQAGASVAFQGLEFAYLLLQHRRGQQPRDGEG